MAMTMTPAIKPKLRRRHDARMDRRVSPRHRGRLDHQRRGAKPPSWSRAITVLHEDATGVVENAVGPQRGVGRHDDERKGLT